MLKNKNKMKMGFGFVVATGVLMGTAGLASAVEFSGYLRTAVGSSSADGDMSCFALPGATAKYRLGNECETYGEIGFGDSLVKIDEGVEFDYFVQFAYFRPTSQGFDALNDNWYLAQTYVSASNIPFLNGGSAWGGKRAYRRHDSYLNDLRYLGSEGDGAGVENIPIGDAKFSYGYFRNSAGWQTDIAATRHDFRFTDIKIGDEGTLELDFILAQADSRDVLNQEDGYMVMAEYTQSGVLGGYNRTALQYFEGSISRGAKGAQVPDTTLSDDNTRTRLINELQWNTPESNVTGMVTLVYQDDEGANNPGTWISAGVRPAWHINNYFKIQLEYGYDQFKPESGDKRTMHKLTVAPTLVAGNGFWSRPEIRLFATYAKWNDAAKDAGVAGGAFADDNNGYTFGVQTEVWF